MRFVKKTVAPQFFHDDTSGLSQWSEYRGVKKRRLRKYILDNEQNSLCIYCETKVEVTTSHLEHIKPKSISPGTLTFDYKNISVSCNGNSHSVLGDTRAYHCGHRKDQTDTVFDETKFLNPVEKKSIRDYFEYKSKNNLWLIVASDKKPDKATYMINTLRLNDNGLPLARKKSLQAFIKTMANINDTNIRIKQMKMILNNETIPHISFLRYKYKTFLLKNT